MSELTKGQVQETATLVVESMQATINQMAEDMAKQDAEIELLTANEKAMESLHKVSRSLIADLREENARLKRTIARLESAYQAAERENERLESRLADLKFGGKQTITPWREDGTI